MVDIQYFGNSVFGHSAAHWLGTARQAVVPEPREDILPDYPAHRDIPQAGAAVVLLAVERLVQVMKLWALRVASRLQAVQLKGRWEQPAAAQMGHQPALVRADSREESQEI
ncbi:hypothetical protein Pmar_PMAR024856 [Perkinsus marinus ATCC 50983]|uniref:Uncharacterized protein n=1 Tax=Perkinsus marinus (strain ATCC 50983 / TXsc) TaxID=423536 RepID=C5LH17_PERM5|nr:hypothetical protein Pmar_PMAR024856 [Perkinsus marinus ATCC 50983]EER03988.1 hypothetical protein Pmar_PMAR024856 [Perkinsus marinus ATCC 50983]|eukprot:XP_002772172.1 hypothetical protein Pmar_PMAR024856 [Perkinsus marinus ATCC 50983]